MGQLTLSLGKVPWEKRTEEGRPAEKIVEHAQAIKADVIVMGTQREGIRVIPLLRQELRDRSFLPLEKRRIACY